MIKNSALRVSLLVDTHERTLAFSFVERMAWSLYGTKPPPPPQFLFAAFSGENEVLGTMGVDFGSGTTPLPLESHWSFDPDTTPFLFRRENFMQYGRWMASRPGVSVAVVYAATIFSRAHGKRYSLSEAKQPIADRLEKMGVRMREISDASLRMENISEEGRNYYLAEPQSRLYMLDLENVEAAMCAHIAPLEHLVLSFGNIRK